MTELDNEVRGRIADRDVDISAGPEWPYVSVTALVRYP
jgi:hypothetical protein